jgi:NADPH:quinone reductase-like Zn-dependent oxidoreductase
VQIAHALGATVYTTASPRNHDFLREIGADTVIDYNTQRFEEVVDDVDVVLDTIGAEVLERSYQVVKPGGYLAALVSTPDPDVLEQHAIRGGHLSTPADGAMLAKVAQWMADGKIRTHVSRTFELSEVGEALDLSKEGHTRGKIVIRVR